MAAQKTIIIVIEDDDAVRSLLTEVLTDNDDRTVTGVSNGAEAFALLDAVRPHLIVLDITLPGIDGIDVYKRIREREDLNAVPVLFLSAQSRARTTSLSGWFKWMSKPFDINRLEATIVALLAEAEH